MTHNVSLISGWLLAALAIPGCQNGSQPAPKSSTQSASSPRPAPPTVAKEVLPESVGSLRPHFALQVAAFNERSDAERLAARLSDEYACQTLVAPVELDGKTLFRVRMLVQTRDEAQSLADALSSKAKVKPWIDPLP